MNRWIRNSKLASSVGFVVVISLIWFLGPFLGVAGAAERLLLMFLVMAIWVVTLLLGRAVAARAGNLLEKMLRRQADDAVIAAVPDRRAEVGLLRQGLLGAIDTLQRSKIGKLSGKAALYELPWYMVIGHPAAGKSSAILQSGLSFPMGHKSSVRGVGGTRNCDWFFSSEGVLLDTAGRYATQSEDRFEWLEFLKLLKRHRPKAPVNGIIVAISLPELSQHTAEGFEIYARQIRARIHEIEAAFGLHVPVYLLFTKLDLMGGFGRFFEGVPEELRTRVWGATLPHDQGVGFDVLRAVGQHFDALALGLRQMGEERLPLSHDADAKAAYFAFPIEFRALKDAIQHFVSLLHENDPYHACPMLRGFYFSSALQDGVPRIAAAARVASRFSLLRNGFEARQEPASYSHFLPGLFRDVLFPDQYLITRQTGSGRSRWRLAGMAFGLLGLALASGAMTWSFVGNQKLIAAVDGDRVQAARLASSEQLQDRLQGLAVLQARVQELGQYRENGHPWQVGMGLYAGAKIEAALRAQYFAEVRKLMLEPVKDSLEASLNQVARLGGGAREDAGPVAQVTEVAATQRVGRVGLPLIPLGGAMNVPSAIASPAPLPRKPVEAEKMHTVKRQDSSSLEGGYGALKTYLMLQDRSLMDPTHLADQLPRHWQFWLDQNRGNLPREHLVALAEPIARFFVSQIHAPDLPLIANDVAVVARARDVLRVSLRRMSARDRVYNELKARANARFAPLTVSRILDGKDSHIVAGSAMVPGVFTREAWEKYMRDAVQEASRGEIKGDDWVLAASMEDNLQKEADAESNRIALEALYRDDYAKAWGQFLQGVAVAEQGSLKQAAETIGRISDVQNSPVKLLLVRASYETAWDTPSALMNKLDAARSSVIEKTSGLISNHSQVPGKPASDPLGVLSRQFGPLKEFASMDGRDSQLMLGYLEHMTRLKVRLSQIAATDESAVQARKLMQSTLAGTGSELADVLRYVDDVMLATADDPSRTVLRPLLVRPLQQAYGALIPIVQNDLELSWQREVLPQWRSLAMRYPFADSSNETGFAEIARFVKPAGTLDRFIGEQLAGLVLKRGDQLVGRSWGNQGVRFSSDFLSNSSKLAALGERFPDDGETARFELQPMPTPGLSEIAIEIDGQALRYRNGPQSWQSFTWPGGRGSEGARIQTVDFSGATNVVASESGRMGLMRLFAEAQANQVTSQSGLGQLEWAIDDPREERTIRVNFRMVSGVNPLHLAALRHISLPNRITY